MTSESQILFEWTCPKKLRYKSFASLFKESLKACSLTLTITAIIEIILYVSIKLLLPQTLDINWEKPFVIVFVCAVGLSLFAYFLFPTIDRLLGSTKYRITDKAIYIDNRRFFWKRVNCFRYKTLDESPSITVVFLHFKNFFTKLYLPESDSSEAIIETFRQRLSLLEDYDKTLEHLRLSKSQHVLMCCFSAVYALITICLFLLLKDFVSKNAMFALFYCAFIITAFAGPGTISSLFFFPKHKRNTIAQKMYARGFIHPYNFAATLLLLVFGKIATIYYLGELFPK